MKTQIITIITALVLVTGLAGKTNAAIVNNQEVNAVIPSNPISKIEVHGNVELIISDGETDKIKVNNKYYSDNAFSKDANGILSITSYNDEKLVVWVTAANLTSVIAYDNAEVKSFGTISKIDFNLELHNNAQADLNLDAFNATIAVNDLAKANLSGTANELDLKYAHTENVNQKGFAAQHCTKQLTINAMSITSAQMDELADL